MDRGCYSEENINELFKQRVKFLIGTLSSLSKVRKVINSIYDNVRSFDNFNEDYGLYGCTVSTDWEYAHKRPRKGDTIREKKDIYMHIYFNPDKVIEDERNFNMMLSRLRKEILTGKREEKNEKLYEKYFDIHHFSKNEIQVKAKDDIINDAKRYYGFFVLLSNESKDTWKTLDIYRTKDVVEKAFANLKERLNMRRTLVSSEKSLDGKLFVQFLALIYVSYINKQMQNTKMYKELTLSEMLDKLDVIECFEYEGKELRVGEILEKQKQIYRDLEIPIP